TLRAGASLNRKIGMVTPSNETVDSHWEQVKELDLEKRFVGIEPIEGPLLPFPQQEPRAMTEALVAAGRKLVDKGAELICPSGLAYITIRISAVDYTLIDRKALHDIVNDGFMVLADRLDCLQHRLERVSHAIRLLLNFFPCRD